ncbi:hypothetical protein BIW11_08506 [Tropilaelaps mercedesae]|uniref:Uncharacterized protein n=1 Tax=Tropilaelaps mercedesae TaxID=418985 RepID=A0A1V9XP69_9ACAR|nr:hypothetical protein BIW11_08506 [Tropilaelaps mercedesae]
MRRFGTQFAICVVLVLCALFAMAYSNKSEPMREETNGMPNQLTLPFAFLALVGVYVITSTVYMIVDILIKANFHKILTSCKRATRN